MHGSSGQQRKKTYNDTCFSNSNNRHLAMYHNSQYLMKHQPQEIMN